MCRAVKLRGNSTGHAPKVSPSQRSESVKLRGNSRVSRGVSPLGGVPNLASGVASARVESVKLRGNSTGRASRCRVESVKLRRNSTGHASSRLRPCRIRQAKGGTPQGTCPGVRACVQVSPPARVETSAKRSRRQAKGELHRARVQVSGHASRCRLPPVSKRPQSVCRTGVSRRQATGHASRCRLRPCRIRQAQGELHRAHVQVSPPRVESVKLTGNSTGHAGVSRCQAKGELHRARAQGVAFAAF